MLKKWLTYLIGITLLSVLAFGVLGTGAWFTTDESISGNSVSTGTLDLEVSGGPFSGTNLEPGAGYTSLGIFCVENIGDYDMKWRGWLKDVDDAKGLRNYLQVQAILNPTGYEGNYGPADTTVFTDVPFTDLMGPNSHILLNDPVYPFSPGYKACYQINAKLLSSAPNAVQAATLNTNLYIQGTQYINTGWGE